MKLKLKINELPVVPNRILLKGKRAYRFPIVILKKTNGVYTWRGIRQNIPNHVVMAGVAHVVFVRGVGADSNHTIVVIPVWVDFGSAKNELPFHKAMWSSVIFDDHYFGWLSDGREPIGVVYIGKNKKK